MFSYLTTVARQNWPFGDQMAFLKRQAAGGAAAAAEEDLPEGLLPLSGQRTLDKDVVPVLERYASRASHDKDLVQWPVTDQDNSSTSASSILCRPVLSTLQSKHSRHEAFIKFINTTPHTIRLLWLDYDGHEVAYDILEPHYSCIQQTFATHPWVAREVNTATRLIINGQEAFCAQRTQPRPRLQQQQQPTALAADNAPAAPPGDGAAGQQQQQQAQRQQEERYFLLEGVNGVRRVPYGSLQVAVISVLPRLAWSEAAHTHFPASFKAAVQTFLMCHHQLQHSLATDLTHTAASCAGAPHHASTMPWFPPASPSSSSSRTHLGHIPHLLLPTIVGMAAPFAPQHPGLPQELRPDIGPTLLPEDPNAPAEPSWFELNDSEDGEDESDDEDEDEDEDDQEAGSDDDDEGLDEDGGPAAMAVDVEDGEVVQGGGGMVAGAAAADGFVPLVEDAAMEGAD